MYIVTRKITLVKRVVVQLWNFPQNLITSAIRLLANADCRLKRLQHQCFFGAKIRAFPALDTFLAIDDGREKLFLRKRADGANFDRGARVVLRASFLYDRQFLFHDILRS